MDERAEALRELQQGKEALQRQAWDEAAARLHSCLAHFQRLGDALNIVEACAALGDMHRLAGDRLAAYSAYESAGEQVVAILAHCSERLAGTLVARGILCAELGKPGEAFLLLNHACSIYQGISSAQGKETKSMIDRLRSHVAREQWPILDQYWDSYQKLIHQASQQQQRSFVLKLS